MEDTGNIMWMDETKPELFGLNEKRCVRRKKNLIPSVKHGGGGIRDWTWFAASGTGRDRTGVDGLQLLNKQRLLNDTREDSKGNDQDICLCSESEEKASHAAGKRDTHPKE